MCAIATCGAVLILSACQSQGSDGNTQQSSTSPSPTTSLTVPSPTPYVEHAQGPTIKVIGARMRGLKSYRFDSRIPIVARYGDEQSAVTFAPTFDFRSLEAMARSETRTRASWSKYTRLEDVVVGGGQYRSYHILDTGDPLVEKHLYGVRYLYDGWKIKFSFPEDIPDPLTDEERQEVMDSILVTFTPHPDF